MKIIKNFLLAVLIIPACSAYKKVDNNNELVHVLYDSYNFKPQEEDVLRRNNIVYFDLYKYNISYNFFNMLDTHANLLRRNNYKVTIEGHADERGTPEYNIALGERRANSVKIYLQSKGISENKIIIVSYGKEKPYLLGHDELAYAKNRRAVLVY